MLFVRSVVPAAVHSLCLTTCHRSEEEMLGSPGSAGAAAAELLSPLLVSPGHGSPQLSAPISTLHRSTCLSSSVTAPEQAPSAASPRC